MFAIEDNMGGVVINISNIRNGGMWDGGWFIQEKTMNISHTYAETIADFIIKYGYKEILEKSGDDIGLNIIKNLKNAYFLVRPYDRDTHRYYMKTGKNCTEYERKKARISGFYLVGVCVIGGDNRIDWVQSYYKKSNIVIYMTDCIEKYLGITLIPTNIRCTPKYWYHYLEKKYKITTFEGFLKLLNNSCLSLENYYYISRDIRGYNRIYTDYDKEQMYIKLLYDY